MWKFRLASWGYINYDDTSDRKKLYDKSLDMIDRKAGNDVWTWVSLRVNLQDIFTKEQPSINNLKKDLKNNLLSKE